MSPIGEGTWSDLALARRSQAAGHNQESFPPKGPRSCSNAWPPLFDDS